MTNGPLIRWPRYVGGALDGQDCPTYPPDQAVVAVPEPIPPATLVGDQSYGDPAGPAYDAHLYRRHHVPFAVGDRRITLVAYAAPDLGESAVAWCLLTDLLAGLDRLSA